MISIIECHLHNIECLVGVSSLRGINAMGT